MTPRISFPSRPLLASALLLTMTAGAACSSEEDAPPDFGSGSSPEDGGSILLPDGARVDPLPPGVDARPPEPDSGLPRPDAELPPPPPGTGRVLYRNPDGFRLIPAKAGSASALVAPMLNRISPGSDGRMNMGADGTLVSESSRFGCSDPCLAIYAPDLASGERVLAAGQPVRNMRDVTPAVAGDGKIIVHGGRANHGADLYVTTKGAGGWSASRLITQSSTHTYNFKPSVSADLSKVAFDCGNDPYAANGSNICEVNIDGTGFRTVLTPSSVGGRNTYSPAYARDGSLVFEGEASGEQIWRLRPGGPPVRINGAYSNDNTPCVLPNGKIASLWLNRPGNPSGNHELKIMNADGTGMEMLVTGVNIVDTGLGCGL